MPNLVGHCKRGQMVVGSLSGERAAAKSRPKGAGARHGELGVLSRSFGQLRVVFLDTARSQCGYGSKLNHQGTGAIHVSIYQGWGYPIFDPPPCEKRREKWGPLTRAHKNKGHQDLTQGQAYCSLREKSKNESSPAPSVDHCTTA